MSFSNTLAIGSPTTTGLSAVINNDSKEAAALVAWEQSGNSIHFYNFLEEGHRKLAMSYGPTRLHLDDDDDSRASIDDDAYFKERCHSPSLSLQKISSPPLQILPPVVVPTLSEVTRRSLDSSLNISTVKTFSLEVPRSLDSTSSSIEWSYDTDAELWSHDRAPVYNVWRGKHMQRIRLMRVIFVIVLWCGFGCIYFGLLLQFGSPKQEVLSRVRVHWTKRASGPDRASNVAPSATMPGPRVVADTFVPSVSSPLGIETMESGTIATPLVESASVDETRITASPSPSYSMGFCLVTRPSIAQILGRDIDTCGTDGGAALIHLHQASSIGTNPITAFPPPSYSTGICLVPRPSIAKIIGRDNDTCGTDGVGRMNDQVPVKDLHKVLEATSIVTTRIVVSTSPSHSVGICLVPRPSIDEILGRVNDTYGTDGKDALIQQVQTKEEDIQETDNCDTRDTELAVLDEHYFTVPDLVYPLLRTANFPRNIYTEMLMCVLKFFVFWLLGKLLDYFAPCDRPEPTDPTPDPPPVHVNHPATEQNAQINNHPLDDEDIHPDPPTDPLLVHGHFHTLDDEDIHPDPPTDPLLVHDHFHTLDIHPDPPADPLLVHDHSHTLDDEDIHPGLPTDPSIVHDHSHTLDDEDIHPDLPTDPSIAHDYSHTLDDEDIHPEPPNDPLLVHDHFHTLEEDEPPNNNPPADEEIHSDPHADPTLEHDHFHTLDEDARPDATITNTLRTATVSPDHPPLPSRDHTDEQPTTSDDPNTTSYPRPTLPVPLRRSARIAARQREASSSRRRSPRLASLPRVSYAGMC